MDYTNITFDDIYSNFKTLCESDPRFKNIGSATLIGMLIETLAASNDMTNFNMQRVLEEQFFRTARLDSSYIKLCQNLGYQPRRPVPAQTALNIVLKGPFPKEIQTTTKDVVINFEPEFFKLNFLGYPYILSDSFSYKFTAIDLKQCTAPDWKKTLRSASKDIKCPFHKLNKTDYTIDNSQQIKCFQGKLKTAEFKGEELYNTFDQSGQQFVIEDQTFSNWYGKRDPFAVNAYNEYSPPNGVTKVAIGLNEAEAFSDPGLILKDDVHNPRLYEIEDLDILLNPALLNSTGEIAEVAPNICSIISTPKKYVSINFTGLKYLADNGIKRYSRTEPNPSDPTTQINKVYYENLYVQYLSTNGAGANKLGVRGSKMNFNNKVYMYIDGMPFDITNNIEFILNTDITGGEDFETKADMRDSANAYFASMMKIVSKRDFIDYFSQLNRPINVNTALIYSQKDIDNTRELEQEYDPATLLQFNSNATNKQNPKMSHTDLPVLQNNVYYSLADKLYTKVHDKYYPRMLYMNPQDFSDGKWKWTDCLPEDNENPRTLYCDEYPNHVTDYSKLLVSPTSFYNAYQLAEPTTDMPQYMQNIYTVQMDIQKLVPINTITYSIPPILHYYDLVGTVKAKKLTKDLDEYALRMNNKLYEYLNEQSNVTREIYKSNIIKLYMDDSDTENVDLDIKVSEKIIPLFSKYIYDTSNVTQNIRLFYNKSMDTSNNKFTDEPNRFINEIIVPVKDSRYVEFFDDLVTRNQIIGAINIKGVGDNGYKTTNIKQFNCNCSITKVKTDNKTYVKIYLNPPLDLSNKSTTNAYPNPNTQEYNWEPVIVPSNTETSTDIANAMCKEYEPNVNVKFVNAYVNSLVLSFQTANNYWSTSNIIKQDWNKEDPYGIGVSSYTILSDINGNFVNAWLNGMKKHGEANRAITLPYTVTSFNEPTRNETIFRRGNIISSDNETLSEYTFWTYLVPKLISTYFTDIDEDTPLDSPLWTGVAAYLTDLYKLFKGALSDSILDDNNNIVNFSTGLDIPVIINATNVVYSDK